MANPGGEVEKVGGSGAKKARIVGGFAGVLLISVTILLLIVIGYLLLGRGKTMPGPETQEKQSLLEPASTLTGLAA